MINTSKENNTHLLFVAPMIVSNYRPSLGRNPISTSNIFAFLSKKQGTITLGQMAKYFNEVERTSYTEKQFANVNTVLNDDFIELTEDEQQLLDTIESDYTWNGYGAIIDECTGFGGTGVRTQLLVIQVLK